MRNFIPFHSPYGNKLFIDALEITAVKPYNEAAYHADKRVCERSNAPGRPIESIWTEIETNQGSAVVKETIDEVMEAIKSCHQRRAGKQH